MSQFLRFVFLPVLLSVLLVDPSVGADGGACDADVSTLAQALKSTFAECSGHRFRNTPHPCFNRSRASGHLGIVLEHTTESTKGKYNQVALELVKMLRATSVLAAHPRLDQVTIFSYDGNGLRAPLFDTPTATVCQLAEVLQLEKSPDAFVNSKDKLAGAVNGVVEIMQKRRKRNKVLVIILDKANERKSLTDQETRAIRSAEQSGVKVFGVSDGSGALRRVVAKTACPDNWIRQIKSISLTQSGPITHGLIVVEGPNPSDRLMHAVGEPAQCEQSSANAGIGCVVLSGEAECGCLPGFVGVAVSSIGCNPANCKSGKVKSDIGHGLCHDPNELNIVDESALFIILGAVFGILLLAIVALVLVCYFVRKGDRKHSKQEMKAGVPGPVSQDAVRSDLPPSKMRRFSQSVINRLQLSNFVQRIPSRILEAGLPGWSAQLQTIVAESPYIDKLAVYSEDGRKFARVKGLNAKPSTLHNIGLLFDKQQQANLFGSNNTYEVRMRTRTMMVASGPLERSGPGRRRLVVGRGKCQSYKQTLYVMGVCVRSHQMECEDEVKRILGHLMGDPEDYLDVDYDGEDYHDNGSDDGNQLF